MEGVSGNTMDFDGGDGVMLDEKKDLKMEEMKTIIIVVEFGSKCN